MLDLKNRVSDHRLSPVPSDVVGTVSASSLTSSIDCGFHTAMHVSRAVVFTSPSRVGGFNSLKKNCYVINRSCYAAGLLKLACQSRTIIIIIIQKQNILPNTIPIYFFKILICNKLILSAETSISCMNVIVVGRSFLHRITH